jgi:RimJ/RimL family protein N-acetyltransferase
MLIDLFHNDRVRLTVEEPETTAEAFCRWDQNSEFMRLLDDDPCHLRSEKKLNEEVVKSVDANKWIEFMVRRLADDRLIGFVGLYWINPSQGEAFMGVGVGEEDLWGKGYGTDAIRLMLNYAFSELNLRRISLELFEYNQRALRSYQKVGFVEEGRMRGVYQREGQRWDSIYMGILRDNWQSLERRESHHEE